MFNFILFFSFVLKSAFCCANESQRDIAEIQNQILLSQPGQTVIVSPGHYHGHLHIERPIRLEGQGRVTLDGDSLGTVVTIKSDDVVFTGFKIINSGESHSDSDAALLVTGKKLIISNNEIQNSFFGIKVKDVQGSLFENNLISSYIEKDLPDRGDSFFVWNSRDNVFRKNRISFSRDFSLNNSPGNLLESNEIRSSRSGFFLVFSAATRIENNKVAESSTGIAALYSNGVQILGNQISHILSGNGSCISTKDSSGISIVRNQLIHCAVGYLSDAPKGEEVMHVSQNLFAHHFVAVRIYGQKGSHSFKENVFYENLVNLILPIDDYYQFMNWEKNYWDDYQGFGKEPYQNILFADRIWMEIPIAKFFADSPFFELIDFLERLAPFSSPSIQAEDRFPQNRHSEVFKRYQNVIAK